MAALTIIRRKDEQNYERYVHMIRAMAADDVISPEEKFMLKNFRVLYDIDDRVRNRRSNHRNILHTVMMSFSPPPTSPDGARRATRPLLLKSGGRTPILKRAPKKRMSRKRAVRLE
jgi:hypothetical protein